MNPLILYKSEVLIQNLLIEQILGNTFMHHVDNTNSI